MVITGTIERYASDLGVIVIKQNFTELLYKAYIDNVRLLGNNKAQIKNEIKAKWVLNDKICPRDKQYLCDC